MSIFEKATRAKIRFKVSNGYLSVEDLWDLNLTQLDVIAKALRKELRDEDDSFIDDKVKNSLLELKFEVVKFIITTRMEEKEAQKALREKSARRQKILAAIEQKQASTLDGMSLDELNKELEGL